MDISLRRRDSKRALDGLFSPTLVGLLGGIAFLAGLQSVLIVCDSDFDAPQQRDDLLRFVPRHWPDRHSSQDNSLSLHLVQKSPATTVGPA